MCTALQRYLDAGAMFVSDGGATIRHHGLPGPSRAAGVLSRARTARLINRLEHADSGRLVVLGEDVTRHADVRRLRAKIGFVVQQFNLYPHLTALQNSALAPRKVLGMPKAAAEERAMELLKRVHLPGKAYRQPAELSGGEQQRVAIDRALAMEPRIILFDEPASALEPELVGEVLDVMRELTRQDFTIICVTPDMGFAREAASLVIFMDHGRIVEMNAPERFFSSPQEVRTKEFLAQVR